LEAGPTVPVDPMWINRTLLAQALQEQQSFGRMVGVALSSLKDEDTRRWSVMADIQEVFEPPFH